MVDEILCGWGDLSKGQLKELLVIAEYWSEGNVSVKRDKICRKYKTCSRCPASLIRVANCSILDGGNDPLCVFISKKDSPITPNEVIELIEYELERRQ